MIETKILYIKEKLDYLKLLSIESNFLSEFLNDYFSDIDQETEVSFENIISDDYLDKTVFDFLIQGVGTKCSKIEIEYPYYDNDYLSVFYIHYAQKFNSYSKKCYRIHFFKGTEEKYCGYIVLRPNLGGSKIGRSYLSSDLFNQNKKYILKTTFVAHVCGERREVKAFPWKHQETDVAVCAHVAIWNILKYYGNKYTNYRDTNIGDIVDKVEENEGRKTPTKGLSPVQASYILKQYGFSPVIIKQNKESFLEFKEELIAYVESGIPILAFLSYKGEHAITILGHGEVDYDTITDSDDCIKSNSAGIEELVIMDDNYAPYRLMPFSVATKQSEVTYCATHIEYYVVPLYDKMQMDYKVVKTRLNDWLSHNVMNWGDKKVYRIYITSSKSLKEKTREDSSMDDTLRNVILKLSLPKFVWCVDFSTENEYKNHMCSGKIIIDSTSENYYSEPWILRHDDTNIEYKDYDKNAFTIICKKRDHNNPYKLYVNNLKEE